MVQEAIVGRLRFAPRLDELKSRLEAELRTSNVPDVLYHYTSGDTLLKILESGKVRATHLQYMNDLSEVRYGHDLIQRHLREARKREKDERVSEFLEMAQTESNPFEEDLNVYAFCFCTKGDELGQWREYAGKGTGYALGFRGEDLLRVANARSKLTLCEVIYDPARQEAHVRRVIEETCDLLRMALQVGDEDPGEIRSQFGLLLVSQLARCLFSFKDPAFDDEAEWRLVHVGLPEDARVQFRAGNGAIVPFVDVDMRREGRMPLAVVVQGPQVAPQIGERSLRQLLQQRECYETRVVTSKVPLRF